MSLKEYAADIGRTGTVQRGALRIPVKVLDVKESYGKARWLVTPLIGDGQEWTETIDFHVTDLMTLIARLQTVLAEALERDIHKAFADGGGLPIMDTAFKLEP